MVIDSSPESHGFLYMLKIQDRYTRYVCAIPRKNRSSTSIANLFFLARGYL